MPVAVSDLERAAEIAASGWTLPPPLPAEPGEPLSIAWVSAPPGPGSGGHTTMFRLISALEQAGHRCILYLRDRHGWALEQHEHRIRPWWPWVQAEVRDVGEGIEDAHAIFATAWETAYRVLASRPAGSASTWSRTSSLRCTRWAANGSWPRPRTGSASMASRPGAG